MNLRRSLTSVLLAAMIGSGLAGSFATAAHAATDAGPTAAPVESADRSADKSTAALNTAVVTSSNTGSLAASITLWRWTGSAWVKEKTGTTNASTGGITFRTVRGGAYYYWQTTKAGVRMDANGVIRPCSFSSSSYSYGTWVARGATKSLPFYTSWNTCGV